MKNTVATFIILLLIVILVAVRANLNSDEAKKAIDNTIEAENNALWAIGIIGIISGLVAIIIFLIKRFSPGGII